MTDCGKKGDVAYPFSPRKKKDQRALLARTAEWRAHEKESGGSGARQTLRHWEELVDI